MPLPYGQVKDLYDQLQGAGVVTQSLPEWSAQMGDLTGSDMYSEGLHDNWIRSTSHSVDKLLDATGLPSAAGAAGRAAGDIFGMGDVGEAAGRSLPRQFVDMAPLALAALAAPETGGASLAGYAGLVGTGLLGGAHTYADTGSVSAGVASGLTNAILPGVANKASQLALRGLGAEFLDKPITDAAGRIFTPNRYLPESVGLGSRLLAEGAGHVAGGLTMGAGDIAREALDPNEKITNPFTPEFALQLGLQTLPFSALHAAGKLLGAGGTTTTDVNGNTRITTPGFDRAALNRNIESTRIALEKQAATRQAEQAPPVTQNPTYDPSTFSADDKATLAEANARIIELRQKLSGQTVPDPQAEDELATLQQQQVNKTGGVGTLDGQLVEPPDNVTHVPLVGRDYVKSTNGKSATFTVADHPLNVDNGAYEPGDRVNYSIVKEHAGPPVDNGDGTVTVQLPVGYHQPIEDTLEPKVEKAPSTDDAARVWAQSLATDTRIQTPEGKQFVKTENGVFKADDGTVLQGMPKGASVVKPEATLELPTQSQEVSDATLEIQRQVLSAQQTLREAYIEGNPEKLHQAKVAFRQAQEAAGETPWDDAHFAEWQKIVDTNAQRAQEGAMNKLMTKVQQREVDEKARQANLATIQHRVLMVKPGETTIDKEEISPLEAALKERLADYKRPDLFWQVVDKWDRDGRKGDLDGLDARLSEKARSRVKEKSVAEKAVVASQEKVAETTHAEDSASSAAISVAADTLKEGGLSDEEREDLSDWVQHISDGQALPSELKNKIHVKEWTQQMVDRLNTKGVRAPRPVVAPMVVGKGWVWGLGDYDEATDRLNGQPLKGLGAKDGVLPEARFLQLAGRGKPLNTTELAVGKVLVPEAFKDGNVDVRKLYAGLKNREPVVETKTLGQNITTGGEQEVARLQHQLDTFRGLPGERNRIAQQLREAQDRVTLNRTGEDTQYGFLGPKAESDMPGYVEGLVRLPRKEPKYDEESGVMLKEDGTPATAKDIQRLDGYAGPHFGTEDRNVLAFYRGYEETLPDGTKAFHVIETQSDWGQQQRARKEDVAKRRAEGDTSQGQLNREQQVKDDDHPLLKDDVWKTLALKAAIQHARDVGATKIILSDAETAMMTEGHDKNVVDDFRGERYLTTRNDNGVVLERYNEPPKAGQYDDIPGGVTTRDRLTEKPTEPSQSAGMRLHYDSALPSAMRKLTGDKGERVELGTHDKSRTREPYMDSVTGEEKPGDFGSPVFRNPDGTPKSSITGTVYDLGEAFRRQDEQNGANTLGDPTRAPAVPYTPSNEEEQSVIERHGLNKTGTDIMQSLTGDATLGGLAKDLLRRFPEALKRIVSEVVDGSDPSGAFKASDNVMSLKFSRGVLAMDSVSRSYELMHELIHGLSEQALDRPENKPIVDQLTRLRQRLIDALPTDQKAIFDNLVKTNWYDKWAEGGGKAAFSDLGGDARVAMRLYGLLNNSELLAQGFSSHDMRQFMESIKGTPKVSGWSMFTNFVKQILGFGERVSGTAFDEFMNYSGRLMGAGEQLSQTHNFLEGYFRQQGAGQAEAQRQTTRALGIIQASGWNATKEGILDALTQQQPLPSQEIMQSTTALQKMFAQRGDDYKIVNGILKEAGYNVTKGGVDDMIHSALYGSQSMSDVLTVLPDSVADYVYAKLEDYRNVMDAVEGATAKINDGLLNISQPEDIRGSVAEVHDVLDKVLELKEEHDEAVSTIQQLLGVSPSGFLDNHIVRAPQVAPKGEMSKLEDFIEPKAKTLYKSFVNWTQQMAQLARSRPESAEFITTGFQLQPATRWMSLQMKRPFSLDPRNPESGFSKDTKKMVSAGLRDPKLLAAVDNWIHQNQKVGGDAVVRLSSSQPDVARGLQGLSQEQKTLAENIVIMYSASNTIKNNFVLNHMADLASWGATRILGDNGQKSSDNFKLTSGLFRNLAMTDWSNPQEAAIAQQQIAAVQSNMTPDQFLKLTKFMQAKVGQWLAYKDRFATNPDWATAKRYGAYQVVYIDNGERVRAGFDSEKEAKLATRGKKVISVEQQSAGNDDQMPSMGEDSAFREKLAGYQATADSILEGVLSPDDYAEYQKYNAGTQMLTDANAGPGFSDNMVGEGRARSLGSGADKLPWLQNQFRAMEATSSYWNRQAFRAKTSAMLNDPEIAADSELRARLAMHADNMLRADPKAAQMMTKLVSTWALGFRPSTAIITASHSIIRHTAELTRLTGKPIESFLRIKNAMSEITRTITGGEQNPEHQWLMKEADKFGERENGWFDDEDSNGEKVMNDFINDTKGEKPKTLGSQIEAAGGTYSRVGMWMFQQARRMNEETALYASYDYYREQGLSQIQARDKAFEFNHTVNTVGGKAQRPVGLFQAGVPRTASMAAYSLKSYVVGTIGQLGRYIMEGSPWAHEDLTPAEKWNARKAALQMVAMQASAAGLLGLPAVGSGIALLNQLFPNLQLPQKTREGVSELLGGDHWSTDVAMGGLPSMLGWDLKSRLSMGNVVPGVSDSDGFQPSNLLGAPVNLATNWITGAKSLAAGDPAGLVNLMPSGVKDILKLANADSPTNDARGRQLFQPTPGEVLGSALGFRPTRLSDTQTQERLSQQTSKVLNAQEGQWRQARAQDVVKGNFGSVRQALIDRSKADSNYDVSSAGRDIASAAETMSFPYDPTRSGNVATSAEQQRLLATFSMPTPPANEVARAQFRYGVLQRLGLNPGDLGSQMRQAQLEDQLKASSPTSTRAQIQLQVRQQLGRNRQPMLSD